MSNEATTVDPECYVRVNIAKNSKGYVHETTVSLKWHDLAYPGPDGEPEGLCVRRHDADGVAIDQPASLALGELLRVADDVARAEIAERERRDAEWAT